MVHVWNKYLEGQDFGVFLATSRNEGRTWSEPVQIGTNPALRTRSAPIEVVNANTHRGSGTVWFIPMYDCVSPEKAAYVGVYDPVSQSSEVYPVTPIGERRNERLAVSRDHGQTWDLLTSVDVFDATMWGDRSYPASVQLDPHTIGTVLYETPPAPEGGRIWFVRTALAELERPARAAWLSPVREEVTALVPLTGEGVDHESVSLQADYRFVADFGTPLNGVELVLQDATGLQLRAGYWMGGEREATNLVTLTLSQGGPSVKETGVQTLKRHAAVGDHYNDGNDHRIELTLNEGRVTLRIDGHVQYAVALPEELRATFRPTGAGISARQASVAVFGFGAQVRTE